MRRGEFHHGLTFRSVKFQNRVEKRGGGLLPTIREGEGVSWLTSNHGSICRLVKFQHRVEKREVCVGPSVAGSQGIVWGGGAGPLC